MGPSPSEDKGDMFFRNVGTRVGTWGPLSLCSDGTKRLLRYNSQNAHYQLTRGHEEHKTVTCFGPRKSILRETFISAHTHRVVTATLHATSTSKHINMYIASTLTGGNASHNVIVDCRVKREILCAVTTELI
jgi:hypothetical protein